MPAHSSQHSGGLLGLSFQVVGKIKIDVCSLSNHSRHLRGPGPVGGDESALDGQALCPQVSITGGQEGRQAGHGADWGEPPAQVTELLTPQQVKKLRLFV